MEENLETEKKDSFFLLDKIIRDKYEPCTVQDHTLMLTIDQLLAKLSESIPNQFFGTDELRSYLEAEKFATFNVEMVEHWLFKEK